MWAAIPSPALMFSKKPALRVHSSWAIHLLTFPMQQEDTEKYRPGLSMSCMLCKSKSKRM